MLTWLTRDEPAGAPPAGAADQPTLKAAREQLERSEAGRKRLRQALIDQKAEADAKVAALERRVAELTAGGGGAVAPAAVSGAGASGGCEAGSHAGEARSADSSWQLLAEARPGRVAEGIPHAASVW